MKIDKFYKILENKPFTDYIVFIRYKYDHEDEYTYSKEILLADLDAPNNYSWLNDWNEGQTDVDVLGCVPIDNIQIPLDI